MFLHPEDGRDILSFHLYHVCKQVGILKKGGVGRGVCVSRKGVVQGGLLELPSIRGGVGEKRGDSSNLCLCLA